MLLIHDEELSRRLEAVAASENRPVEELLKSLLDSYAPTLSAMEQSTNTSDWILAHIGELAFATDAPIDPEQADDILRSEFADALLKRIDDATGTDTH